MATKIRLARAGAKKSPYYKIIIADSTSSRDGAFIEVIGSYNPLLDNDNEKRVIIKKDRVEHWLSQGAQPTDRVVVFLKQAGIAQDKKIIKEANERLKVKAAAIKKANEEKKKEEEAEKAAKEAEAQKAEQPAAPAA